MAVAVSLHAAGCHAFLFEGFESQEETQGRTDLQSVNFIDKHGFASIA